MINKLDSVKTTNTISNYLINAHNITKNSISDELKVATRDKFTPVVRDNFYQPICNYLNEQFEIGKIVDGKDSKIQNAIVLDINVETDKTIIANIFFINSPVSKRAVNDLGYDVDDFETFFNFDFGNAPDNPICDLLFDWDSLSEIALDIKKEPVVYVREACKIFYEFYEPIRDARVNWK